jgi:hypothetical protein
MSDSEAQVSEQQIENKINKEIEKLKYYLQQTDELIEEQDLREIETVNKRTKAILDQIYSLFRPLKRRKLSWQKVYHGKVDNGRKR